jgi:hypothetical protein
MHEDAAMTARLEADQSENLVYLICSLVNYILTLELNLPHTDEEAAID